MIHSRLKQQTSASHLALEVKLRALMSDDLSLEQYAWLLGQTPGEEEMPGLIRLIKKSMDRGVYVTASLPGV